MTSAEQRLSNVCTGKEQGEEIETDVKFLKLKKQSLSQGSSCHHSPDFAIHLKWLNMKFPYEYLSMTKGAKNVQK